MNVDGNRVQTEENAIALYAYLLPIFKWSPKDVNPHQKWSGKYCPAVILKREGSFLPYRRRIESACTGKVVNEVATYLQKGDIGAQVRLLQHDLIKAGLRITVDGSFGPATESAVKAFQTSNGLDADGFYGPATKSKLEALIKPKPIAVKLPTERYRLTTGTFESKEAAEKARKELKDRYGWVVYVKEE